MAVKSDKVVRQGKNETKHVVLEPPNGGWGWVVMCASIIYQLITVPILQNFGLIYKERLKDLNLSSTDVTTIISMNLSVGSILGVFQGPLLKRFGFRKMALFGVTMFFFGTLLTSLANSFFLFILFQGIISSIGFMYSYTSFSMAMNMYFKKGRNRIRASGFLIGCAGLGPVLMPQFVTFSLRSYGVTATGFLLAALSGHSFAAACLLRPVQWYMKRVVKDEERQEKDSFSDSEENDNDFTGSMMLAESVLGINDIGVRTKRRTISENSNNQRQCDENQRVRSSSATDCVIKSPVQKQNSWGPTTLSTVDDMENQEPLLSWSKGKETLTMSSQEQMDRSRGKKRIHGTIEETPPYISDNQMPLLNDDPEPKKGCCMNCWSYVKEQFDLDLLRDYSYISLAMGMSIAMIGELLFSLLLPFVLNELGLDIQSTALFMSICASADIVSRFAAPYLGELLKANSKMMYSLALFLLFLTRGCLLIVNDNIWIYIVAVAIGLAKGVRSVYLALVIPDNIPREKLGASMSFQGLMNGSLIFISGPLSGAIVQATKSYLSIIYIANMFTMLTLMFWAGQWIIFRVRTKIR